MTRDTNGRHDFDFIYGKWHVHNRKLTNVTDPTSDDWVAFDARSEAYPILGGLSHVDRIWADAASGSGPFEGFTLRQFDPSTRLWRIWWASTRAPGALDAPVEGRWRDGRGVFECDDEIGDRPVRVRFVWTNETPSTARWEQSFSYDAGGSWTTNWTMDLARAS